jgi:hypothetical protein
MTDTIPKDSLIGVVIEMASPCRCGDDIAVTGPGAGPHIASVLLQVMREAPQLAE